MGLQPLYQHLNTRRIEEICNLWNQEIGHHFPLRTELFRQNSVEDANVFRDGSWLAVESSGKILGMIISKIWQECIDRISLGKGTGWIQVLLVDSAYRNQGIGTALLQKAEQALKEKGINKIMLGRDPWHYFPGIPDTEEQVCRWFEARGYTYSNTVFDMYRNSTDQERVTFPRTEGLIFRLLGSDEREKLLSFLQEHFPGRWEYEARHYVKRGGTGREFVVLEKEGQLIGFCRINDSASPFIAQNVYWSPLFMEDLGGIGPLGIARAHRKNGYGLAIVQAACYFLQQRGMEHLVIDWTELVSFYQKLGFSIFRGYNQYLKVIEKKVE